MNDEAFARRFYADRAELDSLGIELKVDKPAEGYYEAENYSLPPENFYLPAIEFTDAELGALRTALSLLDGEFAYAEPLRLALQQLSWGKPSPLDAPEQRSVALAVTAAAGGRELSQRLSKVETAIFRRKTIVFDYYTIGRDAQESRKVDPYHLLYRGGQFYLIGHSHERDDVRVFRRLAHPRQGRLLVEGRARLHTARGLRSARVRHPHRLAARRLRGHARAIWISNRIDWLAQRHFGHAGARCRTADGDGVIFETDYADSRADGVLGARPRRAARASSSRRSWWTRRASASRWSSSATPTGSGAGRPPPAQAGRAGRGAGRPTAGARRRSAPSASPAWSRSPAS